MLRQLFGEPRRIDSGELLEAKKQINFYLSLVQRMEQSSGVPGNKGYRLSIWSKGFVSALDELEQSQYCSIKYAERITHQYEESMSQEETDDYHRHIYFFKNAIIRLFSILDKLGYFLDEQLKLNTRKIKDRFSYFTVLRQMHDRNTEPALQKRLYEFKTKYKEPMSRLRKLRNSEIHAMNAELLDDMMQAEYAAYSCVRIENLQRHLTDLDHGFVMVCQVVQVVFKYLTEQRIV